MAKEASTDKSTTINLNLEEAPTEAVDAENYPQLFALWSALHNTLERGRMSAAEFAEWDSTVKALLRSTEITRFEKPLRPHIPMDEETIQHARHFHLTKILWARKGIEKLMADTGF